MNALKRLCNLIAAPITRQWPLWLAIVLLLGASAVPAAYAYLLCTLACLTRRQWPAWTIFAVMLVLAVADDLVEANYRARLGAETLRLIAETSAREAQEWIASLRPGRTNLLIALRAAAFVLAFALLQRHKEHIAKTCLSRFGIGRALTAAALALTAVGVWNARSLATIASIRTADEVTRWDSADGRPKDTITNLVFAARCMQLNAAEMRQAVATARALEREPAPAALFPADSLTVVLVIGESHIRSHSSLYGYRLDTNPNMRRERDRGSLVAFADAVTPFDQTTPVLKNMLCTNALGLGEQWSATPYLPAIFARAGFSVNFFDNQRVSYRNSGATFAMNAFLYDPYLTGHVYTTLNDSIFAYDGELVGHLARKAGALSAEPALTIVHLLGQHFNADSRYPADSARFTPDSLAWRTERWLTPEMREQIAHYDNACRYGDGVLRQIIDLYRAREAIVVYVSDHGEEMYDYRAHKGRDLDPTGFGAHFAHTHFDVPMLVWWSDTYARRHPDLVDALQKAAAKPYSIDLLPHLLLRLAGVASPHYRPERDPLNDTYRCPPRLVAGVDYDKLK